MKPEKYPLAPVHWFLGQALLPEHFQAQEGGLRQELLLLLRQQSMPFWGVGHIAWDKGELVEGRFSLRQLTLLLRDGTLIDIPGNAPAPPNLNLPEKAGSRVSIYLHLKSEPEPVALDGALAKAGVKRRVHALRLSTSEHSETADTVFQLAEFKKSLKDVWSLSEDFHPPLLRVTGLPFLAPLLEELGELVNKLKALLHKDIELNSLANANRKVIDARECLRQLYRFEALLANLGENYQAHPFELFRALHELYIEVCMLHDTSPDALVALYAHDNLAGSFKRLVEAVRYHVQQVRTPPNYIAFKRKEGLQVCTLHGVEEQLRKARGLYLLLQKPNPALQLELKGLKLASVKRLKQVHTLSTQGIGFSHVDKLPFRTPFSSDVEFYELTEGKEWDHAVQEGVLAFEHLPELEQVRAFFFWSTE
jgi:type VI secretion system protein ImpJ